MPYSKECFKNVFITTNGCSENRSDCAKMQEYFKINGWSLTSNIHDADLILFNACGLTNIRENHSLKLLKLINSKKKTSSKVIIWGCFPKINGERIREVHDGIVFNDGELERLEEIFEGNIKSCDINPNYIIPPFKVSQKKNLFKRLLLKINFVDYNDKKYELSLKNIGLSLTNFVDSDSFFIKVSTGCLSSCSYCGVRFSRGRLKSKPVFKIAEEFEKGIDKNFTKFTLIGTDLAAYGRDRGDNLSTLLKVLMKNDCDFKIRLPNVNPRFLIDMIPEFREIIRTGKIEAMGIGVQSGNNRILKLMNRGYRIEDFKEAVSILKSEYPPLNIRTNIIVGFPSETEEEFQDTLKLIKEIDFTFADVHRYSPRSKTKAATMKGQLPPEVIEKRFSMFNEVFLENLRKNSNRILFFN